MRVVKFNTKRITYTLDSVEWGVVKQIFNRQLDISVVQWICRKDRKMSVITDYIKDLSTEEFISCVRFVNK